MLTDLARKAPRSANTRLNLILVRLACCCGLRVSEIAKLQIDDVRSEVSGPHLRSRRGAAKGDKPRIAPLWWDSGTRADLTLWKTLRPERGAGSDDPFLASLRAGRQAKTFSRPTLRKRFRTTCEVLGCERFASLTINDECHMFVSHALAGGRTLAEVRDAAGHANVRITSRYLHVAVEGDGVGELFAFDAAN